MKQVILLTTDRFIDSLYSYRIFKSILEKDYDKIVLYHYDKYYNEEVNINRINKYIKNFNGETEIVTVLNYTIEREYRRNHHIINFRKVIKTIKRNNVGVSDFQYKEDETPLDKAIKIFYLGNEANYKDICEKSRILDVFKELESIGKILHSFHSDLVYSLYGHIDSYEFLKYNGKVKCDLNCTDYIIFNTLYMLEISNSEIDLTNFYRVLDKVTLDLFDDLTTLDVEYKKYLPKLSIKLRLHLFMSWTSTYYEYWPDLEDNHIATVGRSRLSKSEIVDYFRSINIANNFLCGLTLNGQTFMENRVNTIIDYRNINLGHLHIYSFGTFSIERIILYLKTIVMYNGKYKIHIEPLGTEEHYDKCLCYKVKFGLEDEDGYFKPFNKRQLLYLIQKYTWKQ